MFVMRMQSYCEAIARTRAYASIKASYRDCKCVQSYCAALACNYPLTRAYTCTLNAQVFKVSEEILSILEENREQLELLMNWCDLCLPANETAFAEAHRLKVHAQCLSEYSIS
jgi:hypothetical protein